VIEPYITGGGAYVLLIKDKAKLKERLGKLFDGPPLAEMGKSKPGECPPPPAGAPTLTPTPTLEVTPTPG
jgi:hypothetical protein